MTSVWALAALWLGLALVASLLSIWFRVSTALSEIVVGTIAQLITGAMIGHAVLGTDESWVKFLSGLGAVVLTFLAGAELDPAVFKLKWREGSGRWPCKLLLSFCRMRCRRLLHPRLGVEPEPARRRRDVDDLGRGRICGDARVWLQSHRIRQDRFGRLRCHRSRHRGGVGADLRAVHVQDRHIPWRRARRLPDTALPWLTPRFFRLYGDRSSELETKFLLLCLLAMGALAGWADSEAVLPAYLIGMVLAGTVGKDHVLVRRLRTLTFGLLTPFYFIRAGSFVSIPSLIAAPTAFLFFQLLKVATKIAGVYPVTKAFAQPDREAMYTTLLMSTGLTFGTISSLFGLSHGIINQGQYSAPVAVVIGSAVIPTLVANAFYLPRHLLPRSDAAEAPAEQAALASEQAE